MSINNEIALRHATLDQNMLISHQVIDMLLEKQLS